MSPAVAAEADAVRGFARRRSDPSTWSRRRRLIVASQWRSDEVDGIRAYVRAVERTLDRPPRQRWAGW